MNRVYHADTSGMDIDQPEPNPHGRLADFAIPHDDNGPARKRLHSDIQTPSRPFRPTPTSPTYHFTQNTPFIFHAANFAVPPDPPAPVQQSQFRPYNPAEWAGTDFGFGQVEDVEMKEGESPARVRQVERSARVDTVEEGAEGDNIEKLKGKEGGSGTRDGQSEASSSAGASRPIAQGAIARVRRRRQREWRRRRGESESEEEQHDTVSRQRNRGPVKTEHTYNLNMNSPTMRHSEIPALLLGYLQFFVNASVVVFVLYLAVQFVLTVRRDVKDKMAEASVEILQEIAECSQLYLTNRCDPALRVPAMDAPCRAWEACMHRDPTVVGRTNVMAETFAGVINSFVDPISWKTMGFTLVTLSFLIILTNSALFNLRHRASPDPAHPPPPQHMYPPLGQPPWMSGGHQGYGGHQASIQPGPGYMGQGDQGPAQIGWGEQGDKKKKGWWW